ncbi:MAG: PHP domain-containing protein [Clostridiaceae bacterium]|nr:PHP domain-containing protein [Clostridiaceae bacterium]
MMPSADLLSRLIPADTATQINATGLFERLDATDAVTRLAALADLLPILRLPEPNPKYINNHIHTAYSFSPYTPTVAALAARLSGLCTAGIVDHDSIAGADEFIAAGALLDLPVTIGIEARISMRGTPFAERRTNNPDQLGVSYMVLHAVPHARVPYVQDFFAPLRARRNRRNQAMLAIINRLCGYDLNFERDVLPLSLADKGGSVTERHLLQALARREDPHRDHRAEYRRVGELKKNLIEQIYIPATDDCLRLDEFVALAREVGAIPAYAYLGDVTLSVTGDKRTQTFEDACLDELLSTLVEHGVRAVTYMPTRNTDAQLQRVRSLCTKLNLTQISGEDINSPEQSFVIEKMHDPRLANLIDSTWSLIAHERGGAISAPGWTHV